MDNKTDHQRKEGFVDKILSYEYYKLISLSISIAFSIIILYLNNFSTDAAIEYFLPIISTLLISISLWLFKAEHDIKSLISNNLTIIDSKINAQTVNLKKEIDENEELISKLFAAFRNQLGDKEFEAVLRDILLHYPYLKKEYIDHALTGLAFRDLLKISDSLKNQSYETAVLGEIDYYPTPFYDGVYSKIIATNIVYKEKDPWPTGTWDRMIELNKKTIKRLKENNFHNGIQRIFIIEKGISEDKLTSTKNLMKDLKELGISIKYIDLALAENRIRKAVDVDNWTKIKKVEDFSVFDANNGDLKYAGRFKEGKDHVVIIVTDPKTIKELVAQFELLWNMAKPFEEKSLSS